MDNSDLLQTQVMDSATTAQAVRGLLSTPKV
jgi:hypothetical protein